MIRAATRSDTEGALGRLSLLWATLAALGAGAADLPAACDAAPTDAAAITVRHTIDGDTVVLGDGRHLRLIGANALELGHDGAPDQPFAREAAERLRTLIARGGVRWAPGRERRDAHGRTLGDLYGRDGRSLAGILVEEGLALAIAVPPNDGAIGCLLALEARARAARRGLWASPERWTLDAREAPSSLRGFARVAGTVSARRERRGGLSIELDGRLELWVADAARSTLGDALADALPGHRLTVRGWWGAYRGRPSLRLAHPAQVEPRP